MDKAPPFVTARSWAIFDVTSDKFMFGKFESDRREVASLTKMMVAYTVTAICEWFEIDIESQLIEVG
jgi:D-alanyl-D-alanine carboxypeptidase